MLGSCLVRMKYPFFIIISDSNKKTQLGSHALFAKARTQLTNEKQGKKKSKPTPSASYLPNPLDQTCIHPESYSIAMR